MPDHMDHVQDAVQAATDAAVAQATAPRRGAADCEECGDPVGEYRQALGARLCLVHQREDDAARDRAAGRRPRP